ncbi:MAG: hypothetical protein GX605_13870, partial [Chloroflexi bacterium]|nr:hypothetical protein [Chloroflexota bacterium]
MGKRQSNEDKPLNKKQIARTRKSQQQERMVLLAVGAIALLVVGLVAAGLVQEYVTKPASPVAKVDGTVIRTDEYQKRWRFQYWSLQNYISRLESQKLQYTGQEGAEFLVTYLDQMIQQAQSDLQSLDSGVLDQMIDEILIERGAQQEGVVVAQTDVQEAIEQQFGYLRNPPTPTPTPEVTAEPVTTPLPTTAPVTLEQYQEAYATYLDTLKQVADFTETDYHKLVENDLRR